MLQAGVTAGIELGETIACQQASIISSLDSDKTVAVLKKRFSGKRNTHKIVFYTVSRGIIIWCMLFVQIKKDVL